MTTASNENDEFDVIILGAGISGLVATKICMNQGATKILIIDEYKTIGGNHINLNFGGFTFDIGTLIFQDDSPLMKYFPQLLQRYHEIKWTIKRITPDHEIMDYPISIGREVFGRGISRAAHIFSSVLYNRLFNRGMRSAEDYAKFWIGGCLYKYSGLQYYVEKFYGVSGAEIEHVFAVKRMGWLAEGASARKVIIKALGRFRRRPAANNNRSYVRPREGFENLYSIIYNHFLENGVTFRLSTRVTKIDKIRNKFEVLAGNDCFTAQKVISAVPLHSMVNICFPGRNFRPLTYDKLISLFYRFSGVRGFDSNILYNFAATGDWKRLTMYSDFYGKEQDFEYFTVEIVKLRDNYVSLSDLSERFIFDTKTKNIFQGDLHLLGSHELDFAYPVYTHGASDTAKHMLDELTAFGIVSAGRQGKFDYLPTARQVTLAVEDAIGLTDSHRLN